MPNTDSGQINKKKYRKTVQSKKGGLMQEIWKWLELLAKTKFQFFFKLKY